MASRTSIENATKKIAEIFAKLSKDIQTLIVNNISSRRDIDIPVVMGSIEVLIRRAEKKAYPLIEEEIRYHYTSSSLKVTNAMKSAGLFVTGKLSEQQIIELNAIISDTLNNYGEALKGSFFSAQKVMTEARKTRMQQIFLEGNLKEESLKQLKDKIQEDLAKDFISIVDKGGREWKLDVYSEMLARTRLREVSNMGLTTRLKGEGYDLVEVSTHLSDHEECRVWEGKILSITGSTHGYPTTSEAEMAGLMHPNCKHRYLPYHPELIDTGVALPDTLTV